ncbi:AI-2E family transporter [Lewinellaceae bacterium SD302]|nr:AI-2E family transporter [Lewinellaceae bacterium SD302]
MPKEFPTGLLGSIRRNLFFILVTLVTIGFLGLIQEFMLAIFWAAVLAIIFYGTYRRLKIRLKGRKNLAATAMTLLILLFGIIPMVLLTIALIGQAGGLIEGIENNQINPNVVIDYVEREFPDVFAFLAEHNMEVDQIRTQISEGSVTIAQTVASRALTYTGSVLNFLVQFTLMLYLLFFFFREGRELIATIVNAIPMGNIRERRLFQRFAEVSRATLKGTVIVAITQGAIGGLIFAILGIPAALLWGVAMTLLALLPVGGSAIVWAPAAVVLFIQGHPVKALILVLVGALIIGLIDNLLRPLLVGKDTGMPDYLVLISTLGGITYFGLSGFVVGPVVAALFITVWEIMGKEYGGRSN